MPCVTLVLLAASRTFSCLTSESAQVEWASTWYRREHCQNVGHGGRARRQRWERDNGSGGRDAAAALGGGGARSAAYGQGKLGECLSFSQARRDMLGLVLLYDRVVRGGVPPCPIDADNNPCAAYPTAPCRYVAASGGDGDHVWGHALAHRHGLHDAG